MSKLQELVEGAAQVCRPCGEYYGKTKQAAGEPVYRQGACDICDRDTKVTSFKHFDYERVLEPGEKFNKEILD